MTNITLNQPFAQAVEKLRRDALSRDDYDPARLFAWGQMMAVSLLEMLKAVEARFGREGQQACTDALVEVSAVLRRGGTQVSSTGAHGDIVMASVEALLGGMNVLMASASRNRNNNGSGGKRKE